MSNATLSPRKPSPLARFIDHEAAGGLLLIAAACCALLIANSPLAAAYFDMLHIQTGPVLASALGPMTVHLWINDGLMALFFFVVGLEIKREWLEGHLSSWPRRILPFIAATVGMAAPALVFLLFAGGAAATARGWAVPAATDIAFALGVLGLLGNRVPASLKLFLVTVAIVDDMGAVAVIALFYTGALDWSALAAAAAIWAVMAFAGRRGTTNLWVYMAGFALLWYFMLLSGVHATVAGVLAAMTVPMRAVSAGAGSDAQPDTASAPLERLEQRLHPWTQYLVIPLFGFANAGVSLAGVTAQTLYAPVTLGIAAGLFMGKQTGILAAIALAVHSGLAKAPHGASWRQIWGVATLCGIGFTMSLFIAALAFTDPVLAEEAKIGILGGSVLSALSGYALLRGAPPHPLQNADAAAPMDGAEHQVR